MICVRFFIFILVTLNRPFADRPVKKKRKKDKKNSRSNWDQSGIHANSVIHESFGFYEVQGSWTLEWRGANRRTLHYNSHFINYMCM